MLARRDEVLACACFAAHACSLQQAKAHSKLIAMQNILPPNSDPLAPSHAASRPQVGGDDIPSLDDAVLYAPAGQKKAYAAASQKAGWFTVVWRAISFFFWLAVLVFLADFAVGNRSSVYVLLRAMRVQVEVPVYAVFFAGIFTGLMFAGVVTGWMRLKAFIQRRKLARRADAMQQAANTAQRAHAEAAREVARLHAREGM